MNGLPKLLAKGEYKTAGITLAGIAKNVPEASPILVKGFGTTSPEVATKAIERMSMAITKEGVGKWFVKMLIIDDISRMLPRAIAGDYAKYLTGIEETLDSRFPGDLTDGDCDTSYDFWSKVGANIDVFPLIGDYVKAFTPDPFQTVVCSPKKLEGGRLYIISVKGAQVNLDSKEMPTWAQVMGKCFDSCADYQCSVTIVEEKK